MTTSPVPLDSDALSLRVTRSVPVWSIILGLCGVVAQAVLLQNGQARLLELYTQQAIAFKDLTVQVQAVVNNQTDVKYKIIQLEARDTEFDRRIAILERAKDIAASQQQQEERFFRKK